MKLQTEPNLPSDMGGLVRQLTDLHRQTAQQVNTLAEGGIYAVHNAAIAAPTTGKYQVGDFIRNLTPVEAGTAGSKYLLLGWCCVISPLTFLPCRVLTGN